MWRRLIWIGTLGALAGACLATIHPVNSTLLRLIFLACLAAAWAGALLLLARKRKPLLCLVALLPVAGAVPFVLPGGEIDATELRDDYLRRMTRLESTPYFWGGENARGIDCSGLPRRALRDALFAYGIRHRNGTAFRSYVELWWFDASARALASGYRDYMLPLATTGIIKAMSYDELVPGDLAVTTDGVHILAYLGDGKWIQADPGLGKVATLSGRTDENVWFNTPVTTHRWQVLAGD